MSWIFLTRSVFVCSLLILVAHLKKLRKYLLLATLFIAIYFSDTILTEIMAFFGSSTFVEIASDNQRLDSVTNLILSQIKFDFDFRNNMSYSSFINLIFSLFPLTLVYLYKPLKTIVLIFRRRDISLLLVFCSALILVVYQMDFLSIFTFYFLINYAEGASKQYSGDVNVV